VEPTDERPIKAPSAGTSMMYGAKPMGIVNVLNHPLFNNDIAATSLSYFKNCERDQTYDVDQRVSDSFPPKIVDKPILFDDKSAFASFRRVLPTAEDGTLYDRNGIDGFVTARVSSSAPSLSYGPVSRVALPPPSAFNSTNSVVLSNSSKSFDSSEMLSPSKTMVEKSISSRHGNGIPVSSIGVESSTSSQLYSANTNPINILALVSSYSSNISNN